MKLGLGLYRHMLTADNFRFARQAGATHIVAHMVNYFSDSASPRFQASSGHGTGWGVTSGQPWSFEELRDLRAAVNAEGLELAAIENFDPAHWHDVLLDGPRKAEQIEGLKHTIRSLGRAGIPVMGYCFTLAGVWGWVRGPFARGEAESVGFDAANAPDQTPIPNGQVWNMTYDPNAPPGHIGTVGEDELWQRLSDFLIALVPVAEEAGVRLAAHPDDPPLPTLRGTARLITHPDRYQRLLDIAPSYHNALEFCQGTIAEMAEGDLYAAADRYSRQGNIAYVHFRNVVGKVPRYYEAFVDEGDVDMLRVLRIYRRNGFDGVIIPDHTPQMSCAAPWHAGMAYALGWMRAALQVIERE